MEGLACFHGRLFLKRVWFWHSSGGHHSAKLRTIHYSSLFNVAWMWLFLAAGWSVRFLAWIDPGWQRLKRFLDIENHPLKSLGIVAGVIGALVFALVKLAVS